MNWIDKCSQADECVTIGNCKIGRLLFADDLVLLSSTESGPQHANLLPLSYMNIAPKLNSCFALMHSDFE